MSRKKDLPFIDYINLGPWPGFVGFTTSAESFAKELARICPDADVPFLASGRAGASTHTFDDETCMTQIVTICPQGDHSNEAYAAMIAHEAMHVVQHMRQEYCASHHKEGLGIEAEAYLCQYLVQEMLAIAWQTGRIKSRQPSKRRKKNGN